MNYLHSGGHDHTVLSRFTEMEYSARYGSTNSRFDYQHQPHPLTTINPINTIGFDYRGNYLIQLDTIIFFFKNFSGYKSSFNQKIKNKEEFTKLLISACQH